MILAYIPTSDVGTIAIMGITPEDLELLAAGEATPLIEFEDAMQRGIPLPKFLKLLPVRDRDHFTELLNEMFESSGTNYDAKKFKPLDDIAKIYEKDDDE